MKNKHHCKKLGLTLVALAMSSSIQAKGLLDVLIDKAVDKVAEAVLNDKPTVEAMSRSRNDTDNLKENTIPAILYGRWGLAEGNRCENSIDMGMGSGNIMISANEFSGGEMSYVFKSQIQGLSSGVFIGRFVEEADPEAQVDMEFRLIDTESLYLEGSLYSKCDDSATEQKEGASDVDSDTKQTVTVTQPYKFSDYPVSRIYSNEPAKLNLASNKNASAFKTRLKEGLQDGMNFAGSYVIVTWGCGTECMSGAMVDVSTGSVIDLPEVGLEQGFQKDSSLYVVNPNPDEPAINPETGKADIDPDTGKPYSRYPSYAETNYYQWNGKQFIKLGRK